MAGWKLNRTTNTESLLLNVSIIGVLATGVFSEAGTNGLYDFIGYGSYDIPGAAENPDDYVSEELAEWNAIRSVSGLPEFGNVDRLPGYIEAYIFFPKIPENKAYCFVYAEPKTGITSLEELVDRYEEAYEKFKKEEMWVKEIRPGVGDWGAKKKDPAGYYKTVFGYVMPTVEELRAKSAEGVSVNLYPVPWSASSAYKDYWRKDYGAGPPGFITRYKDAEAVAKEVLSTNDVVLDSICLHPPFFVFEGAGRNVYVQHNGIRRYYIDGAIEEVHPGIYSGGRTSEHSQNPDGTPKYSEESRAKWEERETELGGLKDG